MTTRRQGAPSGRGASPTITVITPAWNVEEYLAAAMTSVMSQTFADFEYVVVDDGSTDATAAVATSLRLQDVRIRVLTVPHQGSSAARNVGIAEAR